MKKNNFKLYNKTEDQDVFPLKLNDILKVYGHIGSITQGSQTNFKKKLETKDLYIEKYQPSEEILSYLNIERKNVFYTKHKYDAHLNKYFIGQRDGHYLNDVKIV